MQTVTAMSPLRRKLQWLLGLRVATVTIVLGTGLLAQIRYPGVWPINPFFILIGVTYGLTVLYGLTLKFAERHRWIIDFQLATDALTVTGMVLLTGGVVSFYSTLYALPIVESPLRAVVFDEAVDLYRRARAAGRTVRSSVDCLIAACAVRHGLLVLHRDRDFPALAAVSALRERAIAPHRRRRRL
jgi:hypothetical protein